MAEEKTPLSSLQSVQLPAMQAYQSPFGQYYQEGMFASPTQALQTGMGTSPSIFPISTEGAITGDVTNTTQDAAKSSSNIMSAIEAVNKFYTEGMKGMYDGIKAKGSPEASMRFAWGRPYVTQSVSARDPSGQFKERTEFDLSGRPITTRGGIEEGMIGRQPQESPKLDIPQKGIAPGATAKTPDISPTGLAGADLEKEARASSLRKQAEAIRERNKKLGLSSYL